MFIGFIFLPESPRWLVFHGHEDRARKVLSQVRGHAGVDEEMAIIMDDYREHSESHVGKLFIPLRKLVYSCSVITASSLWLYKLQNHV